MMHLLMPEHPKGHSIKGVFIFQRLERKKDDIEWT